MADPIDVVSDALPTMEELATMAAELQAKRQRYADRLLLYHASLLTEIKAASLRREYEEALLVERRASPHILELLHGRAAIDCMRLSDLMYRKLPAELRQIIYRFLCVEDQPIPVGPYYHFRPYDPFRNATSSDHLASALSIGRSLIDHRERPDPAILMPDSHIFKPTYLSHKIACEAREAYFSNNTFSICNVDMGIFNFVYGHITYASTLSPPGHTYRNGIVPMFRFDMVEDVPAYKLANKLQIRLKYEHMNDAIIKDVPITPLSRRETFANECSFLRNSKNSLSALHCMQAGNKTLEIEFIIMTAVDPLEDKHRRFINILQSLRNTIYALKYDREDSLIKVVHHDDDISPFPRNITALWGLTKEQWEHEKQANESRNRSTWDADFYIAPAELDSPAQEAHGGVPDDEMADLLRERWGIKDALKDTRPKWPIKEGIYWPVGKCTPGWW